MELTKEWIKNRIANGAPEMVPAGMTADEIWKAVQLDRQRVRDEAIAEVKKDHFKLWEAVESENLGRCRVGLYPNGESIPIFTGNVVRRPLETRPMTDNEMMVKVISQQGGAWVVTLLQQNPDWTPKNLCLAASIPTEVPDEAN